MMAPELERADRQTRLRRVVALGGGTGLPTVLRGLRAHLPRKCRITAIVTAADDGGSSGVLRREYGVLPPGDIRNCLVALARVAPEVTAALQSRIGGYPGPDHAVGNLLLAALDMVAADEIAAIRLAANLLRIDDVLLPSTTDRVQLVAELADGRHVLGESSIPRSGTRVLRVSVDPADALPARGVLEALRAADAIVIGPGSLYTSVLATLVIPGVAEAVAAARAMKLFVCNLLTEPGETDGYSLAEHLEALTAHGLPADDLDYIVTNGTPIRPDVRARYALRGVEPVAGDCNAGRAVVVTTDLLARGPVVRHDPDKVGSLVARLAASWRGAARGRTAA